MPCLSLFQERLISLPCGGCHDPQPFPITPKMRVMVFGWHDRARGREQKNHPLSIIDDDNVKTPDGHYGPEQRPLITPN
jgi:hypothetical protein